MGIDGNNNINGNSKNIPEALLAYGIQTPKSDIEKLIFENGTKEVSPEALMAYGLALSNCDGFEKDSAEITPESMMAYGIATPSATDLPVLSDEQKEEVKVLWEKILNIMYPNRNKED